MAPFPTPIEAILGHLRTSGLPFSSELPFGFCLTCEPMSGEGGSGIHHRLFVSGDLVVFWGYWTVFRKCTRAHSFARGSTFRAKGPLLLAFWGPLGPFWAILPR